MATVEQAWLDELSELLRIPSISADPSHGGDVQVAAEWVAERSRPQQVGGLAIGTQCRSASCVERRPLLDRQAIENGAAIIAGHHGARMEIWRGTRLVQSFGPVSPADPRPSRR